MDRRRSARPSNFLASDLAFLCGIPAFQLLLAASYLLPRVSEFVCALGRYAGIDVAGREEELHVPVVGALKLPCACARVRAQKSLAKMEGKWGNSTLRIPISPNTRLITHSPGRRGKVHAQSTAAAATPLPHSCKKPGPNGDEGARPGAAAAAAAAAMESHTPAVATFFGGKSRNLKHDIHHQPQAHASNHIFAITAAHGGVRSPMAASGRRFPAGPDLDAAEEVIFETWSLPSAPSPCFEPVLQTTSSPSQPPFLSGSRP